MQRLIGKALAGILVPRPRRPPPRAGAASLITGADIQNGTRDRQGHQAGRRQARATSATRRRPRSRACPARPGPAAPPARRGRPARRASPAAPTASPRSAPTALLCDDVQKNVTQDQISHDADTGIYCFTFPAGGGAPARGRGERRASATSIATLQIEDRRRHHATARPTATVRVVTYDLSRRRAGGPRLPPDPRGRLTAAGGGRRARGPPSPRPY